ncbi:26S proteasome non-ATPase regulatory subunit [Knufia obscura]|uniref:26S proteasome non-ATPase regulatory subunit n=2 Tax=Knufia TaxID=430999 RepID=A0AAN8IS46_9EURO|nr:26S proteasome non-ATPase regulatory subunit [Knufia obscura]KAK5957787.1 26S proteasome non-ATPase regulatory subunit [Knufia fluminis]
MSGDKSKRNSVSRSNDSKSKDKSKAAKDTKTTKDNDGDEEMTVVVPPPKTDQNGDVTMNGATERKEEEVPVDPKVKAATDIKNNLALLERAVSLFDPRFTLRVLRSIPSIRKHLSAELLSRLIIETYTTPTQTSFALLKALGDEEGFPRSDADAWAKKKDTQNAAQKGQASPKEVLPEVDIYLAILLQVYFHDTKNIDAGVEFSQGLVKHLRKLNRRTLDSLAARVYFYYSLFFEETEPFPPSPNAAVVEIRQTLLDALRTATLRKDQDTQASVTTLLLRNYLSTSHITQADLLIQHSQFPDSAANNQVARYLYYLGRIRAIQLSYSEAHEHLIGATRKAPTSYKASGFYQVSTKLLIVVELLMGDIPDRAIFRQPSLEKALAPYLQLVQAVSSGDVTGFQKLTEKYSSTFRSDSTYTLILRLRQNVIKTGIRMMSLSYARISLRDMCIRLGLDSEESAEYIVAKAIRDGVIEATLDHEHGYMKSKDVGDIYGSQEPFDAYSSRIRACLALHDESVKAMRFPMNQHRLELKNAQEARERERELAKEIVDGDLDEEDGPGGDFEGL